MSWEDTLKADKEIKEEIQKVWDHLHFTTFFPLEEKDIETAMTMLEKILKRFD